MDDKIALVSQPCAKFHLKIDREPHQELYGTIDFPGLSPPANTVPSPYPPTDPLTTLPPASATPRLVKFFLSYYTNIQPYDLFRPCGALVAMLKLTFP